MTYMEPEFPGDADEARVRSRRNMSDVDRWLSIAAGTGLALYGLSRRKSTGWFLAVMGGMLLQRGASGHCHTYDLLGINTAGTGKTPAARSAVRRAHVDESVTINWPIEELLPLLAEPREPAAVHAPPRIGRTRHRHPVALAGPRTRRRIVEWNAEIINEAEQGHRLALD